jgi:F0F1-type ATP synthase assembly protein I
VPEQPAKPPTRPAAPGIYELLQIGAMCGVCIGVGTVIGLLLDRALGTTPLLVFVGLALGILGAATGSYYVIRPFVTDASRGAPTPKD